MNLKQVIPYNIKTLIPGLMLAGASIFTACEKEPTQRDIELTFSSQDLSQLTFENLQKHANDPTIRTIYMVPIDSLSWTEYRAPNIQRSKDVFLIPRFEISPKLRGRGDFPFKPGEASKVPEDSLWFIEHGWTINRRFQKQK